MIKDQKFPYNLKRANITPVHKAKPQPYWKKLLRKNVLRKKILRNLFLRIKIKFAKINSANSQFS